MNGHIFDELYDIFLDAKVSESQVDLIILLIFVVFAWEDIIDQDKIIFNLIFEDVFFLMIGFHEGNGQPDELFDW